MGLSFGGIASGLPPNIVDLIVNAERKPLEILEKNKANQEQKLTLLSDLRGKVAALKDNLSTMTSFSSLRELKARSSDESLLTVTVDKERAKPGIYTLQVEKLAKKASAISNGFPDKDYTEAGIGYIVFDVKGEEKEIFIGEDNNTLEGIAATINNAGLPVRASIVHDEAAEEDEQFRLIIATEGEGADQSFNFPNFYFLDGDIDFYFANESESGNGRIVIDGFPISTKSNKLTEIIPGATLNLLDAKPNKNVSIIIEEDIESVGVKAESFVAQVNAILDFFESQFNINEKTDTSKTLAGDTSLQSFQYRLRNLLQNPVVGMSGKIKRLSDIGINFNRGGKLEFNKKKFLSAANEDFKAVSDLFSMNLEGENRDGDKVRMQGVAVKLYEMMREVLYGDGIIAIKEKALRDRIGALEKQLDNKERHLEKRKTTLKREFAQLEQNMSKFKAQQAQMARQLGGMSQAESPGMLAGKFTG